ncbi:glycosyl hydrolase [uncultured Ruminococcus sp.]|uniref:glycosyl hydrolase n=1 Tax=uncultured Ruminococcus sp. TaxID=165186 RepID=UPI00263701EF|nr:glycosyl hydrolase [uncultured Ruminococcus sp.]
MRKQQICALLAAVMMLTGCAKIEQEPEWNDALTATPVTQLETEVATETTAPQHPAVALQVPEITRQDASLKLEAEDAAIPSGCSVAMLPRLGYSGTGYLSGLDADNHSTLVLTAEIPATQHYDITVVVGSGAASTCKILANGEPVYTMTTDATENFMRVTVQGIFLSAGDCELSIVPVDGLVDIDCVELTNNTSLYDEIAEIDAMPVNTDATAKTKQLYQFLTKNYGSKIITGQYVSDSSDGELNQIYTVTGKYPMIRFADMGAYSPNGGDSRKATAVEDSLAWAEEGGVVGLSWLWNAPTGTDTIYAKDATFDLAEAVTDADVAMCSPQELSKMEENGEISASCYALLQDIDAISAAMQPLADADVPVLWRPLGEAGGGWYWWGSAGADAYCWLWDLMYTRMTAYHKLNNLLWVWNGQSSSFLVEESQYDIASLDLYVDKAEVYGSRYEQYVALRNMVPGKMLAISECSTVPDMNAMFRDNAVWSFFGLWYAPYLGEYTDNSTLIAIYNSEGALTREDFSYQ